MARLYSKKEKLSKIIEGNKEGSQIGLVELFEGVFDLIEKSNSEIEGLNSKVNKIRGRIKRAYGEIIQVVSIVVAIFYW